MKRYLGILAAFAALTLAVSAYAANWNGFAVSLCSTTVGCPATPTPSATPTPIVNNSSVWRPLDLVNSFGANTKLIQGFNTPGMVINAMNYLGITHFRDTATVFLTANQFGGNYSQLCTIAAAGGRFIVLPAAFGFANSATSQNNIAIAQSNLEYLASCGALDETYVGGQNEYNNSDTPWLAADCPGGGSYWACEQYQQAYYQMVHNSPPNAMCTGPGTTIETTNYGGTVPCCTGQGTGTCPNIQSHLVISGSDVGAENDNVGLQFLTIPAANATGNGNGTTNIPLNCCAANGNSGSGNIIAGTKIADIADTHNYVQNTAGNILDNMARYSTNVTRSGPDPGSWDVWGEFWGGTATANQPACGGGGCDGGTWGSNRPIGQLNLNAFPKVSTEQGWTIFKSTPISLALQGRMIMDMYLDQYQMGFSRTWLYLLINDNFDGGYGFFNGVCTPSGNQIGASGTTCTDEMDGTNATPLGLYMHNLTSILADTTANFTPTAPSGLAVTNLPPPAPANNDATNYPSTGYYQIMEKSNGTYELVIWGEAFVSESTTNVNVNLGSVFKTVNTYDITLGTAPQTTGANIQTLTVPISDHPLIVEFHN